MENSSVNRKGPQGRKGLSLPVILLAGAVATALVSAVAMLLPHGAQPTVGLKCVELQQAVRAHLPPQFGHPASRNLAQGVPTMQPRPC